MRLAASANKKLRLIKMLIAGGVALLSSTILTCGALGQTFSGTGLQGFEGTWVGTTSDEQIDSANPSAVLNPYNARNYADKRQLVITNSGGSYEVGWDLVNDTVTDNQVPSLNETAQIEADNPNSALASAFKLQIGTCSALRQRISDPSVSQNFIRVHIDGSYSNSGAKVTYIDTMCCFLRQQAMACYAAANYWLLDSPWYKGHWDVMMTKQQTAPPLNQPLYGNSSEQPLATPSPQGESGF